LAVAGREHRLADPALSSILTAGLPGRGMTVAVTEPPFTERHLIAE